MKTKEEILQILRRELPFLKEEYHVVGCGLFGSYVRDEAAATSDIDVLIELERPVGFFKFIELEDYLSEKLGAKVDLVTQNALKPLIRPYVMENIVYA